MFKAGCRSLNLGNEQGPKGCLKFGVGWGEFCLNSAVEEGAALFAEGSAANRAQRFGINQWPKVRLPEA